MKHPHPKLRRHSFGFTLLEILIALSVFAILATITSSAMYHAFNTRAIVNKQADRLGQIQLAMALIQRDTQQIAERPVRINRRMTPAFIGQSQYLEFTRGGMVNPDSNAQQSTLIRIAFLCKNDQLIRRRWEALDTSQQNRYQDKVLLKHLNQCKFAYLAHNHDMLSEWHERPAVRNPHKEFMPSAIQFTFNLKDWGNMSLLFIIPEALYAE